MSTIKDVLKQDFIGGKYINPYTDFGFKKIFGTEANKDILQHFLQTLLQLKGKINRLNYLNSARLGRSEKDRGAIFDIYCETDRGEKFIVEMQKAKQKFFKDRSVYYASFPIQEQAKQGKIKDKNAKDKDKENAKDKDWDFELKSIYTVGILDFVFDENKNEPYKYYYHVQLSDTDTHEVFYDKLTFVYLEMPKFTKAEDELKTVFDKWLFALKNLPMLQDRPKALKARVFQRLFRIAEFEKLTPEEKRDYDESLKHYWDMNNVINTAVEEAVEKVNKVIKEKDKALEEKDKILEENKKALEEKDKVLEEKDKVIEELRRQIHQDNDK
jgi:hypothetical protein